jgi:hypothetical protein
MHTKKAIVIALLVIMTVLLPAGCALFNKSMGDGGF